MRTGSRLGKKFLFLGVGSALMFTMGGVGTAQADTISPPHNILMLGTTGIATQVSTLGAGACASCHRVHTASTATLLKEPEAQLCDTCHNGQGSSLNVEAGTQSGSNTQPVLALRGGGFKTAAIDAAGATKTIGTLVGGVVTGSAKTLNIPVLGGATGAVPIATTSQHLVDGVQAGTMWGNGIYGSGAGLTGVVLQCGSCHDPHGNGNYRMLRPVPVGSGAPKTAGVNIPDQPTASKLYTTTNYWDVQAQGVPLTAAQLLEPAGTVTDGFLGSISAWCTTCHTRYLSSGASNKNADTTFTYQHRSDEQASNTPNCIQCHVSHGSDASVAGNTAIGTIALENPDNSVPQNSDLLRVDNRGTCLMCHNK
jgi:predicted CXXCH cytochrome family protein